MVSKEKGFSEIGYKGNVYCVWSGKKVIVNQRFLELRLLFAHDLYRRPIKSESDKWNTDRTGEKDLPYK